MRRVGESIKMILLSYCSICLAQGSLALQVTSALIELISLTNLVLGGLINLCDLKGQEPDWSTGPRVTSDGATAPGTHLGQACLLFLAHFCAFTKPLCHGDL